MNQHNNMTDPNEPPQDEQNHDEATEPDMLSPDPLPDEAAENSAAFAPAEDMSEEDTSDAKEIERLEAELSDNRDKMLRAVAESENTRKRLLREREDVRKYAVSDFARDLLDFSDNFRRALASIPEDALNDPVTKNIMVGVESMEKELLKTMEKHGITKTEPMDEPFDPNFHEAMFEAPGTGKAAGMIIEVIEPGYILHDRLLRPARVGIAKDEGPTATDPGGQVDTQA